MNTEIQLFNNPEFGEVRTTLSEQGEPLFCLADVCKALELSNPSKVKSGLHAKGCVILNLNSLSAHDDVSDDEIDNTLTISEGASTAKPGNPNATFITEANLYRCIFQSRKQKAEVFQDWVTDEVLPSIRRHGASVRQIAKDFGKTANWLNMYLCRKGIQFRQGKQWMLYEKYAAMDLACSVTAQGAGKGHDRTFMLTKWTEKGRRFLTGLLAQDGIFPVPRRQQELMNAQLELL